MPAARYVHPEFGFFCPTPRLRGLVWIASSEPACAAIGIAVLARTAMPTVPWKPPISTVTRRPGKPRKQRRSRRHAGTMESPGRSHGGDTGQGVVRATRPLPSKASA